MMGRIKLIITSIVVLFFSFQVNAQQSGCYVISDKTVYPNPVDQGLINSALLALLGGSKPYYSTNPDYSSCGWTPASGSSCKVCVGTYNTFLGLLSGCNGTLVSGVEGTFGINCPIDDSIPFLLVVTGAFFFFYIRRKQC